MKMFYEAFWAFIKVICSIVTVAGILVFLSNGTASCTKGWLNQDRVTCSAAVTFNIR